MVLTLDGKIQDENFLRFLEKIGQEKLSSFSTEDFLILDLIHNEQPLPSSLPDLKIHLKCLMDLGVIERIGQGRGTKHSLSERYYKHVGQSGIYTRKMGLDRATNKELLLKHIRNNAKEGSKLSDLRQVFSNIRSSEKLIHERSWDVKNCKLLVCMLFLFLFQNFLSTFINAKSCTYDHLTTLQVPLLFLQVDFLLWDFFSLKGT